MANITICTNKDCSLRVFCWRFNALPSDFQEYAKFIPDDEGDMCDFFVSIEDTPISELMEGESFP